MQRLCLVSGIFLFAFLAAGCQSMTRRSVPSVSSMAPVVGLEPIRYLKAVQARLAPPDQWRALPVASNLLYTHQQWKSQTSTTGVGVAYVRLPLPIGARAVAAIARDHYTRRDKDGKVLATWSDPAGREWFDVQNSKYRVRGYVIARGLEAWFVYAGYRHQRDPQTGELELAYRSMETITPRFQMAD